MVLTAAIPIIASALPANAVNTSIGSLQGRVDLTVSHGVTYRLQERNDDYVALGNGGRGTAVNGDDGTLNYKEGIVSNMSGLSTAITLQQGRFTAYVQGSAFYDFEQKNGQREHRDFSSSDLNHIGSGTTVQEYYLQMKLNPMELPIMLRVGDQTVNWGESVFPSHGVDIINPLDAVSLSQPLRFPNNSPRVTQGMIWGASSLTERIAVEAYYQYEWEPVSLLPAGAYFSSSDVTGKGRSKFIQLGGGRFSDLGTDLDAAFSLPEGTLGFDDEFQQIPQGATQKPDDDGQFGMAMMWVSNRGNASKWGVHYVRYHSRLPIISGMTANQQAVDETSTDAVNARADQLFEPYLQQGATPSEARALAQGTAEQLTLGQYSNQSSYFIEYPEDISMFALTFNTATLRTGTLVAAEVSHHIDAPVQLNADDVATAILSPIQFNPDFAQGPLGEFAPDATVTGFTRKDRSQLSVSMLQILGQRLGATQSLIGIDAAYVHIHDYPTSAEPALNARNGGSEDSWGYRALGRLTYNNVLGALNASLTVAFSHDVHGDTPGPYATFWEGRKSLTFGIDGRYLNRLTAGLVYTSFYGGGDNNPLNDRDFVRFNVSYGF